MKTLVILFLSIIPGSSAFTQTLNIDPALTAAVGVAAVNENNQLTDMKHNQSKIIAAQTSTTALVNKINTLQQKTLDGLQQVSTAVRNAYQIVLSYQIISKIYDYQSKMLAECVKDPLASLLAYKIEKEMIDKSLGYYNQIATLILASGKDNLMDTGERCKLLDNIVNSLQVLEGYSFNCYYTVHLAVLNGVFKSLNPFSTYTNNDKRIINQIMTTWKF
ncbi:MAG: hypothetical protein ABI357_05150 [Granulicella sp.]